MSEPEQGRARRPVTLAMSLGAGLLFAAGFVLGALLGRITPGIILFALGAILFAVRGYLRTGEKVTAAALIFVALTAIGIQLIVFFLGP